MHDPRFYMSGILAVVQPHVADATALLHIVPLLAYILLVTQLCFVNHMCSSRPLPDTHPAISKTLTSLTESSLRKVTTYCTEFMYCRNLYIVAFVITIGNNVLHCVLAVMTVVITMLQK